MMLHHVRDRCPRRARDHGITRFSMLLGALGIVAMVVPQRHPALHAADMRANPGGPVAVRGEASARVDDPVAELQQRLASGELTLAYDSLRGYLPSLLEALDIPVSSQTLVFSRTSLQTDRIAPWAPRALYFNDEVYVGWVQESPSIEIASIDPIQGAVFYTLAQTDPVDATFTHETRTCLMCHESRSVTAGVPGLLMRSVLVDRLGYPITEIHPGATTDRTPFEKRWGGWYVTGTHGNMAHAGNTYAPGLSHEVTQKQAYLDELDFSTGANVEVLEGSFDVDAYLTPHSDLVAALVLTHQTQVHNLITLVHEETAAALKRQALAPPTPVDQLDEDGNLPATLSRVSGPVERLLQTMLFVREAPMDGPVRGTSPFTGEFSARGPRDSEGRSLRDFDLETRIFRHPMSFLIYSNAFDALPTLAKRVFARRLMAVLSGKDSNEDFQHLTDGDRRAVLEILEQTKPELLEMAG